METQFPTAWLAYPRKFHRLVKLLVYDEQGSLEITRGQIRFDFRKNPKSLLIGNVKQVNLVRQPAPWPNWLLSNGLIFLGIHYGFFKTLTWQDPLTIPVVLAVNLLMISVWWFLKWGEVQYVDEAGLVQTVYLTDGSAFGWGGILGGGAKIHWALESCLKPESDATSTH